MTVKDISDAERKYISEELRQRGKPLVLLAVTGLLAPFIPFGLVATLICVAIIIVKIIGLWPLLLDNINRKKMCGEFKMTYRNDDMQKPYIMIDVEGKERKIVLRSAIMMKMREKEKYYYEFAARSGRLLLLKKKDEVIFSAE